MEMTQARENRRGGCLVFCNELRWRSRGRRERRRRGLGREGGRKMERRGGRRRKRQLGPPRRKGIFGDILAGENV